jgi:hypothetical protein
MQITILATATVSGVLDALLPGFERMSGHTVMRWDATAGKVRDRILEGAQLDGRPADVGFITGSVIADVEKAGAILPASKIVLARSALGARRGGQAGSD